MKVTVLAENTSLSPELTAEHGLSLYIETEKHRILFDMGQSDAFLKNAEKLGIDLCAVDLAFLSHGHYDHGGGLIYFLEQNNIAPVYISSKAMGGHYNGEKYIGLDKRLLQSDRIRWTGELLVIDEELSLFSHNQSPRPFPTDSFGLTLFTGTDYIPDPFLHEQYLLIMEGEKSYVISGCSHKGILNIAQWFSPDVLIGGFHYSKIELNDEGKSTLSDAAETLLRHRTTYYTGHCTGEVQFNFLKEKMGDRLQAISTGMTIEF